MRLGFNPHKDQEIEGTGFVHQIVIPVYIPNEEGYFKDSFSIFNNCLMSLLLTVHSKTYITIVNNGSCDKVVNYLNELFEKRKIQELIHSENIGKLNAIIKGITGNNIELVTIADADVLFCSNWQKETVKVFNTFSKAGVVGLVPQFKMFESNCGNVLFDNFFSSKLQFKTVENKSALVNFYESLGWDRNYNNNYLNKHLTVSKENTTAVIGSGHFVATYKKELFTEIVTYIEYKMGANSELYLDKAPLYKGLWRLTTSSNFAFHMGNVIEPWMKKELDNINDSKKTIHYLSNHKVIKKESRFLFFIKNRLFVKLFSNKLIRMVFYRYKKLPNEMISKY